MVIYNESVIQSKTCKCLRIIEEKYGRQAIYIFDNSDKPIYDNKQNCINFEWNYYASEINKGLSKAYNIVIKDILLRTDDTRDVIVLLDDDTELRCDYYEALLETMSNIEIDIAAPYIIDQNGTIISPNNAGFLKNRFIKYKEDAYKLKKFNAINSCTAIRLNVFDNYSYDESLFLDLVDSKFFEDQRKLNRKFGIIACEIFHNIQLNSESDSAKILNRYKIRVNDLKAYCRAMRINRLYGFCKAVIWSLLELYKHNNLKLSISILKLWFK